MASFSQQPAFAYREKEMKCQKKYLSIGVDNKIAVLVLHTDDVTGA